MSDDNFSGWRWWFRDPTTVDETRLRAEPLALIGDHRDSLDELAFTLDPARDVVPLVGLRVTATRMRAALAAPRPPIFTAPTVAAAARALDLAAQPYFARVSPIAARPNDAMRLLRGAAAANLDQLGTRAILDLASHEWTGLRELRTTARYLTFLVRTGNITQASAALGRSTRQAMSRYLSRRLRVTFVSYWDGAKMNVKIPGGGK